VAKWIHKKIQDMPSFKKAYRKANNNPKNQNRVTLESITKY